jgi:hypothetical protein
MRFRLSDLVIVFAILFVGWPRAHARSSPAQLAQAVVDGFCNRSEREFASIYPFREGREALSMALAAGASRKPGLADVIRVSATRAVLLLSAVPMLANSGDATVMGRGFSGLYEARPGTDGWELHSRIPLDDAGTITGHHIKVSIRPASGLEAEDRIQIGVRGPDGFAVRLNHATKIQEVRTSHGRSAYRFAGGLLWVDLPVGTFELTVRYEIDVENRTEQTNSGSFLEAAGHVRNQYFWHPFFDLNATHDRANFEVEARIPRNYHLSTSLPQNSRIEGGERIVVGRTARPTMALSLVYDRDWKVISHQIGAVRLDFFVTPEFRPDPASLVNEFQFVHQLLSQRFGTIPGRTLAIVEARSFKDNPGWRFASNQIIVAAGHPPVISMGAPLPMAPLAHEIAHLWTDGANGPAMNFLTEGWATYVESLVVARQFGEDAAKAFWKARADMYLLALDGKANLLEDDDNAGIAYTKGAWLFRMLEEAVGRTAFDRAITDFSRSSRSSRAGWELLAECAQRYVTTDVDVRSFLVAWLRSTRAPRLSAEVRGRTVTIVQEQPHLPMPIVVAASTPNGQERQHVWLAERATTVSFSGEVSDARIDPDGSVLLRH